MFDSQAYAEVRQNVGALAAARDQTGLATGGQVCAALRDVQASIDVLGGIRADLLARLETTGGHAQEGASTSAAWARRELRMGAGEARKDTRAGATLQLLPRVAQALAEGRIRPAHVYEFTAGVTKLGASVMADLEEILLPVAETSEPGVLRDTISQLHEVLHPEELDKKYAAGMERKDLKATKCGEGFHVSGFLDIVSGAKFSAWLKDVSGPEYDGDDRSPAQRRVDAFCRVFETALRLIDDHTDAESSAETDVDVESDTATTGADPAADPRPDAESPADAGASPNMDAGAPQPEPDPQPESEPESRPGAQAARAPRSRRRADTRLLVLADLETLLRMPGAQPATLAGFGHIGQQLLGYLTCGADMAGILTHGLSDGAVPQAEVLNVGRTQRLATPRQRDAVLARQDATCAAPGCASTYLEIHHVAWWDRDTGRTDLDNLVGICSRCHHLVHQHKLTITADEAGGFIFTRSTGRVLDDHERATRQRTRQIIADLRRIASTGEAPKTPQGSPTPHVEPPTTGQPPVPRLDQQWLTRIEPDRLRSAERQLYDYIGHHQPSRS